MGTSASGKGRQASNPLVPSWADADPGMPLPPQEGRPFQTFRTEFGRWAAGGGGAAGSAAPALVGAGSTTRGRSTVVRVSVHGVWVEPMGLEAACSAYSAKCRRVEMELVLQASIFLA